MRRYKYRLVVDESLALGVLGATGRGACEHFGLSRDDVEIVSASLGAPPVSCGARKASILKSFRRSRSCEVLALDQGRGQCHPNMVLREFRTQGLRQGFLA